jgi:hypothetical protein
MATDDEHGKHMQNLYLGATTTEALFRGMSSKIDELTTKLDILSEENHRKHSEVDAMRNYGTVMTKLGFLEDRLERLEKALMVTLPNGQAQSFEQIGGTVSTLMKEMEDTIDRCSMKAEKVAMQSMREEFTNALQTEKEAVVRERASAEAVLSLQTSHRGITMQVGALQTMLGGKVDKAELEGMNATLQQLEGYSSFRGKAIDRLSKIEADAENTAYALDQQVSITTDLARQVNTSKLELEQRPTKAETATSLRVLREEMDLLRKNLEEGSKNLVSESSQSIREYFDEEQRLLKRYVTENAANVATCTASLETMATKKEVNAKASVEGMDLLREKLEKGLEEAASNKDMITVRVRTTALESHFERLAKHTEVMHRFINWYHDRGAVYDHNNSVIERHLGKLVRAADPKGPNRQPFDRTTLVRDQAP